MGSRPGSASPKLTEVAEPARTCRVGAGALITNPSHEVLLVKPTDKDAWEISGGLVEAGESPRAAATRELREELGLDVTVGRLLAVDWDAPGQHTDLPLAPGLVPSIPRPGARSTR
ncbi:MAG: NUDIX domain-containing protein [Oryzihumus sp.]